MMLLKDFFEKLGGICARLNILSKPMLIYNLDETGISVAHKPGCILTELGRKRVWSVTLLYGANFIDQSLDSDDD